MTTYEKFYGQRTCTSDITVFTDYHTITHTTVAEMLQEEDLSHEIDTIQISTCHKYISSVLNQDNYYWVSANKYTHYYRT